MSISHMSVSDLAELAQLLNIYRYTYEMYQEEATALLAEVRREISDSPFKGYSERNPRGAGRHGSISDQQKEQVIELYGKGSNVRQIASETDLSVGSVHKLINEHRQNRN